MGLKKSLLAGLAAAALSVPCMSNAATLDFLFNWGGTTEGGSVAQSAPVHILDFTAESSIQFTSGTPFTAGATFNDFVVLRINQLFDSTQTEVNTPYGNQASMQITVKAWLTGTQIDATNYVVNGIQFFEMYYDGPNNGYTSCNFSNLSTCTNGQNVEGATAINGAGTNSTLIPDGALNVVIALLDLLTGTDFELDANGNPIGTHWLGITNSNNALCNDQDPTTIPAGTNPTQECGSTNADLLAFFGQNPELLAFHTANDGTIQKITAIPEPGTLGLLGLALAAMGFVGIRRRRA